MRVLLTTIVLLLAFQNGLFAQDVGPFALSGWAGLGNGRAGVVADGNGISYSSPAIAEIDGDTSNGKEVAVAAPDGTLNVFKSDGSKLWSASLPNKSCTATGNGNKTYSSPSVGNLFGDGVPYVVIGYGGVGGTACGGGVVAFRGPTGERRWHFDVRKFDQRQHIWAIMYSVFGSPALADVNGDGVLEVAFGSFDRGIYLLDARGKAIWRYTAADTSWSSPAFADINGDGRLEVIAGTDISANQYLQPPTPDGGIVYALRTKGVKRIRREFNNRAIFRKAKFKNYNFRDSKLVAWRTEFDQTIMSSPSVAEVDPNSPGLEIVVGSGCYFPEGSSDKRGKWFKILRASDGQVLRTLTIQACSPSSAAVGDIDEDGIPEVVVTSSGDSSLGGDGNSRIIAFNGESGTELWSVIPSYRGNNHSFGGYYISPVIADLDGNGSLEVAVGNLRAVGIYEGKTGAVLSCQSNDCADRAVFQTGGNMANTPAIGDLDGDGRPELVVGNASGGSAVIYAWTRLNESISSAVGIFDSYSAPWPHYRQNAQRSGKS